MTAWMPVLVPLLMMFFALGMQRVESRLRPGEPRGANGRDDTGQAQRRAVPRTREAGGAFTATRHSRRAAAVQIRG
jgi:hypothetical protein